MESVHSTEASAALSPGFASNTFDEQDSGQFSGVTPLSGKGNRHV